MISHLVALQSDWQRQAVCFVETSGAPEVWTPSRRPSGAMFTELKRMCDRCPVRVLCATQALVNGEQNGIYAGVYLPGADQHAAYEAACEELSEIAGVPLNDVVLDATA